MCGPESCTAEFQQIARAQSEVIPWRKQVGAKGGQCHGDPREARRSFAPADQHDHRNKDNIQAGQEPCVTGSST